MNDCYNNIGTKVLDINFRSTDVWFETMEKKSYEWGFGKNILIWDTSHVSCCGKGI